MDKLIILIILLIFTLAILEYYDKQNIESFNTNTSLPTITFGYLYNKTFPSNPLFNNTSKITNIVPQKTISKHSTLPPNPHYNKTLGDRIINDKQFIEGTQLNTSTVLAKNVGTPRVFSNIF